MRLHSGVRESSTGGALHPGEQGTEQGWGCRALTDATSWRGGGQNRRSLRRGGAPEKEGVGLGGGSPSHLCPHLPHSRRRPVPVDSRRAQEHAAPARGPSAAPGPAAAAHGNPPASAVANMAALSGHPAPSLRLSRRPRARPRPAPPPSATPCPGHAPTRKRAGTRPLCLPSQRHLGFPDEPRP